MVNKFKDYLTNLGLNYKKEVSIILILNLLCIIGVLLAYFFTKELYIALIVLSLIIIINFVNFYRYSNISKRILDAHEDEFITVISYFQIFINNHFNVYQSFQNTINYTSEWMKEKLEIFLHQIDEDKTIKPFINFANNFKSSITHNVMLSIYQMIDEGETGAHMMQFSLIFENLSRMQQKNLIDKKEKGLSSLSSFPLIGAGLITLIITFSVILIMGDMINVL